MADFVHYDQAPSKLLPEPENEIPVSSHIEPTIYDHNLNSLSNSTRHLEPNRHPLIYNCPQNRHEDYGASELITAVGKRRNIDEGRD